MTRARMLMLASAAVVLFGLAALILTRTTSASDPADPGAGPTASVTTAPVRAETLQDITTAYGVVQADATATDTLTAPRDLVVLSVLVRPGESVGAGQRLVAATNGPAAELAYRQAVNAVASAQSDVARVQRLFEQHLAASDQLTASKKALADAEATLAVQKHEGAGQASETFAAPWPAVVTAIAVSPGDRLAQNAAMITLARQGSVSARLGLEPGSGDFRPGEPTSIRPTQGGPPIASRLAMVGRTADPATRLIDAVAPLDGAALPIGASVEADIVTGTHQGLVVPRSSIVFDETGAHVFLIAHGKAQRAFVTAGRNYGDLTEVTGPISAGQPVVVQGAYELEDGMTVKVAVR